MAEEPGLFIALYSDEHILPQLMTEIRARGYRAETAQEAGMLGRTDEEHLIYASQRGMAILSGDKVDFPALFRAWADAGRDHSGIIISPAFTPDQFAVILRWTLRLLDSMTADEMKNNLVFLQQFRDDLPNE